MDSEINKMCQQKITTVMLGRVGKGAKRRAHVTLPRILDDAALPTRQMEAHPLRCARADRVSKVLGAFYFSAWASLRSAYPTNYYKLQT
jgi:hypothetical protein